MLTKAMHLPYVLRLAATLVMVAITVRYFALGSIMMPPFATIVVLFVLSYTFARWPRSSALLALVSGILIPVGPLLGHLNGTMEIELLIFDWIVFSWLIVSAIRALIECWQVKEIPTRRPMFC